MAVSEKPLQWGYPADDPFVHPVKRLCLRSPSLVPELSNNTSIQTSNVAFPLDLNQLPTTGADVPPSPSTTTPSLDCLGEDLLLHVLRLAQPTAWDLCRMACVSKGWRDACYNPFFWTKLRVGPGSMRQGVDQLSLRCKNLKELHIDDAQCELHILHPIVVACGPSLRRVCINCDMDRSSQSEASICSILWIISLYCKNVESIDLLSDGKKRGFSYLETKVLWFLTSGFRNIRSFASLCQESITKQSLYLLVIAWRDLSCLRIHSGALKRDDLASLRKCHALRILELTAGKLGDVLGERIVHSQLEVLVLSNMILEADEVYKFVQLFPGLKKVLVNKESWAYGDSVPDMAVRRFKLKQLQAQLKALKSVELLVED